MSATPDLPQRRAWLRATPMLAIGALCVALLVSGQLKRLSLSDLAAHRAILSQIVAAHPLASLGAYVGLFLLIILACVPGPIVMSVAGGFLFGPVVGALAALTALIAGGVAVFLACRTAFGDWAAHRAGPTVARLEAGFSRDAFSYLLALRLMPGAPFFVVNLAAGLARVRLSTFVLATVIGTSPSVFILAGLGAGLDGVVRRHGRLDASLLSRPDIAAPLAGVALLALAPPAWRFWRSRRG